MDKEILNYISSVDADKYLIDKITELMDNRLTMQRSRGYRGWQTEECTSIDLKERLLDNARREEWVDVANLAAMLQMRYILYGEEDA